MNSTWFRRAYAHIVGLVDLFPSPQIRHKVVPEQAELDVVGVTLQCAEIIEPDGTEVDLSCCFQVAVSPYLVYPGSGHRIDSAVPVDLTVIHVVVPETSEIGIPEG